tara:strand:+ start:2257 stop:2367 length:111 start_codon:yes stop_codon:yes gene_type:complete
LASTLKLYWLKPDGSGQLECLLKEAFAQTPSEVPGS